MSIPRIAYVVTTWYGHKLIETIQSLPKGERLLVIDTSVNGWCLAKAWNYGLRKLTIDEGYDVAIVLNDDVVLKPETGQDLADALLVRQWVDERPDKDREVLLLSGYNISHHGVPPSSPPTKAAKDLDEFKVRWGTGPDYSCWAATRKLLDVIGPFDESFVPAWFEDNDSHYRIFGSGFQALSYAPYFHYASQTVNGGGPISEARKSETQVMFDANKAYYVKKWGGLPGRETYTVPFGANKTSVQPGALWQPSPTSVVA
jgi:hypothetical protein